MNTETRESVWEGMVETDRLHRYYGKLAGKLVRKDRCMTIGTCLLAFLTAALAHKGITNWTVAVAILTAISGGLPLVYRLGRANHGRRILRTATQRPDGSLA